MASTIEYNGDSTYTVVFNGEDWILTTFTSYGDVVDDWIRTILRIHRRRLHHLVVGLDTEWRPDRYPGQDNPVALLQLCVGRRCLLFHIAHADYIPDALEEFLSDGRFRFVGVGVDRDAGKLWEHHELQVDNAVELGELAAAKMGRRDLTNAGLSRLAREVMGVPPLEKSKSVTMSKWDSPYMSYDQLKYAAVDAFVSFEIGRRLFTYQF